jgi:hypothetical protein
MRDIAERSFAYRLLRSLLPSPISAVWCLVLGVIVVGGYLVMSSLSLGTSLPGVADGEWGIGYTNNVVRPLLSVFSSLTWGNLVLILLWGLGGLVVYFLLEYAVSIGRNLSSAEHTILITRGGIVRHPTIRAFLLAAIWRFGVLVVFVPGLVAALQPPLQSLTIMAPHVVSGAIPSQDTILHLVGLVGAFGLLFHGIVAFLRLMSMRTRLFGADISA